MRSHVVAQLFCTVLFFAMLYISIFYVLGDNFSRPTTSQQSESGTDSTQEDKKKRTTTRTRRIQSKPLMHVRAEI